jgi:hypothetical protein
MGIHRSYSEYWSCCRDHGHNADREPVDLWYDLLWWLDGWRNIVEIIARVGITRAQNKAAEGSVFDMDQGGGRRFGSTAMSRLSTRITAFVTRRRRQGAA